MKRRFRQSVAWRLSRPRGRCRFRARAKAQEIQLTGPLTGAPAVRQLRLYREGRFEIAPSVSFTLLDEYRRTIFLGGRLAYNIKDWLAIGVWGAFGAVSSNTDLATEIDNPTTGSPRDPLHGDQRRTTRRARRAATRRSPTRRRR